MIANVNKCAVIVCNEEEKDATDFKYIWGNEKPPMADQYTSVGVEYPNSDCFWDAYMGKVVKRGKGQTGKMV